MELRSELELYRMTVLRCSELVTRYPFFQSFENGISKFIKVLMHVIYAFALTVVNLVGPDGFEPSTQRLFVGIIFHHKERTSSFIGEISPERVACSNQLSYGPDELVGMEGFEPTWLSPTVFETVPYTSSGTFPLVLIF